MSQVEEIKERLNIVDVISEYVKLSKAGKNFKGLSPFTNEKTPSFYVSPDKGMYYCFSSNKGGDIFTFIEEMERVDFPGALKILAEKAGVELKREYVSSQSKDDKERLYEILEQATRFYQKTFVKNEAAFRYMKGRGISSKVLKEFRVGFAPDSWDALLTELTGQGFSPSEIEKCGLVVPRTSGSAGYYDRFRSRIMFPVCDTAGRVVGFSGRIFEDGTGKNDASDSSKTQKEATAKAGQAPAKYINTPETSLYHKSNILFGFDKGKDVIRKEDSVILVEGQMDVLASHEAGVKNVVAVSGTSLTDAHLKILTRFTKNLTMSLDADRAGQEASNRSAKMALSFNVNVSVVTIEGGKDPSDLVQSDPTLWKKALEKQEGYIDYRIAGIQKEKDASEMILKVRETLFPQIMAIPGAMKKDALLKKVSTAFGISLDAIREEYDVWQKEARLKTLRPQGESESNDAVIEEESRVNTKGIFTSGTRKDMIARRLLGVIFWQKSLSEPGIPVEETQKAYFALVNEEERSMIEQLSIEEQNTLSFESEVFYDEADSLLREVSELLLFLEIEMINQKLGAFFQTIRLKEQTVGEDGDQGGEDLSELQGQVRTLSERREQLQRKLDQTE